MKAANILKVVDIESTEFFPEFLKWLSEEIEPTYRDQEFKEHLYNIDTILENQAEGETFAPMIQSQLSEIQVLTRAADAGYFRITEH